MQQSATVPAPRQPFDEADIGSGEKSPGQQETDEQIRRIPRLPEDQANPPPSPQPSPPPPPA